MSLRFLGFLLSLGMTLPSFGHNSGEGRVTIEPTAQQALEAGIIHYDFQLFDTVKNRVLLPSDLAESNTKILHVIAYDEARKEFNHVHPTVKGTTWSVQFSLPKNGTYFIWAQGQLADGTEFSTFSKAIIEGGAPANAITPLGDQRFGSDDHTLVSLTNNPIHAGQMAMLNFTVSRDDGQAPLMAPYLGALAHLIAASPDGDELIHVHPMAGGTPNTGMIHASFPSEGDYRIWIQFIDRDVLKTIPVSVTVVK